MFLLDNEQTSKPYSWIGIHFLTYQLQKCLFRCKTTNFFQIFRLHLHTTLFHRKSGSRKTYILKHTYLNIS